MWQSNAKDENSFWLCAFEVFQFQATWIQAFRNIIFMYAYNFVLWMCVRRFFYFHFSFIFRYSFGKASSYANNRISMRSKAKTNTFIIGARASIAFSAFRLYIRNVCVLMHGTFAELSLPRWTWCGESYHLVLYFKFHNQLFYLTDWNGDAHQAT